MRRETLCPVVGALVLAAVAAACGSDGDGRTSGARPSADAGADAAVDQSADVGDGSGGDAGASGAGGQGGAAGTGGNGGIGAAGASGTAGTGGAGAAGSSGSAPIDLRSYFPDTQVTKTYRHDDGSLYSTYTYFPATPSFSSVYETFFTLQKPGRLHVWAKGYGDAGCIATYAHLFLGDDLSFTEVGDYLANDGCNPSVVFGYGSATSPANDGLAWSAPGGLPAPNGVGETAEKYGLLIKRQNNAGDAYLTTSSKAWNRTVIVEVLPSFRPAYGRSPQGKWGEGFGKDYANVVRIVFYHGTQVPNQDDIAPCTVDPTWPYASYYYSLPDYHSYGSEYYLAEGEWIIQEAFLYTEDGSYWGIPNCVGLALDKNPAWVSYVDGG